jgi:hypothetical protein
MLFKGDSVKFTEKYLKSCSLTTEARRRERQEPMRVTEVFGKGKMVYVEMEKQDGTRVVCLLSHVISI